MFLLVVQVFGEIVLPIFVMVALGYIIARTRGLTPGGISTLVLHLFAPALAFSSLTKSTQSGEDALQIVLFVGLLTAVMYLLSLGIARVVRMDRATESAFLLTSLFMNAGNFGLSFTLLAFGEVGMETAIVFFVCQATMGNTLGIFLASRSSAGIRDSITATLKAPLVYAALAAVVVSVLGLPVPDLIAKPAAILGAAAIPTMLVVLGAQLASSFSLSENLTLVAGVSAVRLLLSAAVAYGLTMALGFEGVPRQTLVLLSAMPTAVFTIIVATEFGANPKFVTSVVIVSTLASLLTITFLLSLLLGTGVS